MPPVSRDVPADDPNSGNARADEPSGVFAALDKVVAETPLATKFRTEGAPPASALERFGSRESAGVFAALDKVVIKASTRERFDSEGPQPVRSPPSAPVDPWVASDTVYESLHPLDGSAKPAKPADVVRVRQSGPGDLDLRATETSGDPELLISPVAAPAPRRQKASEPAFLLTESASQAEQDNRGRLQPDRAPFEHVNGALAPMRSAVWPLGFALVLGVSLGFAGGYEVASWPRRPEAPRAGASAPAAAAEAASESAVRAFGEGAVREPATAATPGASGADMPPAPNAAQPPAREQAAAAPAAAGRLLVNSTPAGARVLLDGRDVGETPVTVRDVANGAHTVRVVRDGYVAGQQRVVVSAARPAQSLTIVLRRPAAATPSTPSAAGQPAAALYVASRPAGASVFLDGQLIGTTPLQIGEVAAGDHTVRLELEGYQRWSTSVRVAAGERSRVAASLER